MWRRAQGTLGIGVSLGGISSSEDATSYIRQVSACTNWSLAKSLWLSLSNTLIIPFSLIMDQYLLLCRFAACSLYTHVPHLSQNILIIMRTRTVKHWWVSNSTKLTILDNYWNAGWKFMQLFETRGTAYLDLNAMILLQNILRCDPVVFVRPRTMASRRENSTIRYQPWKWWKIAYIDFLPTSQNSRS